jgi:hypothetical protein
MKNENAEKSPTKESVKKPSFKRPELKKHGKLKNTASQQVSTYTYTTIT